MFTERHILIVEDNPILRNLLTEIFRECGWQVRTANDGFASLQAIEDELPAMLLSDLEMDGMSGFEMLSIVRRRFPSIKVVAMSGAYSGNAIPVGVAADRFYAKGGSVSKLLDLVAELCGVNLIDLKRADVPVWIPLQLALGSPGGRAGVACSSCLRSIYLNPVSSDLSQVLTCPYCRKATQVLFLGQLPAAEVSRRVSAFPATLMPMSARG